MFSNRNRRGGFTLPEVLVTVAIVAVLAAAVVPTVVNQMSKGETGAVVADLNSLGGGITTFVTDTRKYPGDLEDLNTRPDASDAILGGAAGSYSTAAKNAWKGPYLATTQDLSTGYIFAGLNLKASNALDVPAAGNGFNITLAIVPASGTFTAASLSAIDQTLDGGDGVFDANCAAPSASSTTGRLTWTETAGSPCVITLVKYRLVPTGS